MKISNHQAQLLVSLLQSTLSKNLVGYLSISFEDREKLLNEILSQQSREVNEINDDAVVTSIKFNNKG